MNSVSPYVLRAQMLDDQIADLRSELAQKDDTIQTLRLELAQAQAQLAMCAREHDEAGTKKDRP